MYLSIDGFSVLKKKNNYSILSQGRKIRIVFSKIKNQTEEL